MALNKSENITSSGKPDEPKFVWAALTAFCFMYWLMAGTMRCYGMLYIEFLDLFREGATVTSSIQTIRMASNVAMTPLVSYLVDNVPIRYHLMVCGVLNAASLLLSAFAPNMTVLALGMGLLLGMARTGMFATFSVHLNKMFDKHRSLANGLVLSSSSLGTITIPFIYGYLLEEFTVRGTLIITAAMWLNLLVAGMVLNPQKVKHARHFIQYGKTNQDFKKKSGNMENEKTLYSIANAITDTKHKETDKVLNSIMNGTKQMTNDNSSKKLQSVQNNSEIKRQGENPSMLGYKNYAADIDHEISKESGENIYRVDASNSLELSSRIDKTEKGKGNGTTFRTRNLKSSKHDLSTRSEESPKVNICLTSLRLYATVLKIKRIWPLLLFRLSANCAYQTAGVFLPAYAEEYGFSLTSRAMLLSILGGAELSSRIFMGIVGDSSCFNKTIFLTVAHLLCGIVVIILTFIKQPWVIYVTTCVLGSIGGVFRVFGGPMILEVVGFKYMATGVALFGCIVGLAGAAVQTPMGLLQSMTGTYASCFQVQGAFYICSGAFGFFLCLTTCRGRCFYHGYDVNA